MVSTKRDKLVVTALELFARDGFHATGLNRILGDPGAAPMTPYNHFKSKDELILAVLHRRDEQFRNDFMRDVERRADTPRDRLLALFDVLGDWFAGRGFTGCMFINASAEYTDPADPIHAAAAEHKRLVCDYVRELATAAGAADPDPLAPPPMPLMAGSIGLPH